MTSTSSDEEFYDAVDDALSRSKTLERLGNNPVRADKSVKDRNADVLEPVAMQPRGLSNNDHDRGESLNSRGSSSSSTGNKRQSLDPLSAHITYRASLPPPPITVSAPVPEEDEMADIELPHMVAESTTSSLSSPGLFGRMGLWLEKPENDTVSHYTTSNVSTTDARRSLISNRSGRLASHLTSSSNNNATPHGASQVKMESKSRLHVKLAKIVLAQTLATEAGTFASLASASKIDDIPPHEPFGAIWTLMFSKDGRYLAAGGQSCIVSVWKVLDKLADTGNDGDGTIKVFQDTPIRQYTGHQADILDISWSKNEFLLSSSMDKTVRLWHISRDECLCVFRHLDFVTGIEFHPKDDRYFLSGSLDCKLRLWNIPDKKVAFWNEVPDGNMVTAVGFTLDGKTACAGSHSGQVFFYETQGLKYNTQITAKRRGAKKGRKITGIEPMPGMPPGEEKMLITSNDSRARLINMKDKSLIHKYKGPDNVSMQIKATFSDDGKYIISGSEDCHVYLWAAEPSSFSPFSYLQDSRFKAAAMIGQLGEQMMQTALGAPDTVEDQGSKLTSWLRRSERRVQEKLGNHNEHFKAHQHVVTSTCFAPTKTRQYLARHGNDIIYNHTPIYTPSQEIKREGSNAPSIFKEAGPEVRDKYRYVDGQILVSADFHGSIKVWRMDSGVYAPPEPPIDNSTITAVRSKSATMPTPVSRSEDGDRSPGKRRPSLGRLFLPK